MTDPYPPWARWIAQDECGEICIFEWVPEKVKENTINGYWSSAKGGSLEIGIGTPNPHWRHSLDCLGEDDDIS